MEKVDAIYTLERLAHTEATWPGTEETLEALDMAVKALRLIATVDHFPDSTKMIHDSDFGADLFYLLHVMGCIDDGRSLSV